MLEALRKGAGTWVAKVFIGLLVLSFAVWGVADIFGNYGGRTLAKVGDREIDQEEFRTQLQTQLRRFGAQLNRSLSLEEARLLGLDNQVLSQLVSQAALDQKAAEMNLGISDKAIVETITKQPVFRDASGNFNRDAFLQVLRASGLSEQQFIASQRESVVRNQIIQTVASGAKVPKVLVEAVDRFNNEQRVLRYVELPQEKANITADPTAEQMSAFYEAHKDEYAAPEYRKLAILVADPSELAKSIRIDEADLKAYYEANQARYRIDEQRKVLQIPFPDEAAAQAAAEKIKGGTSFADVAKEQGLTEKDIDLGNVTRLQLADKTVADAAFSLQKDEVSGPVKGQLATVIVTVTEITPGVVTSFEEARTAIEATLAQNLASQQLLELHDKVEDERAGGASLAEIGQKLNMSYRDIDAVDRQGKGPDGKDVEGLPGGSDLLSEAFGSPQGVEHDPVETSDQGYAWFNVLDVTPSRQKTLDEVREQVAADWKKDAVRDALSKLAQEMIDKVRGGESLEKIAGDMELEVRTSQPFKRNGQAEGLPPVAVQQAFSMNENGLGSAAVAEKQSRVVFQLAEVRAPSALSAEGADALAREYANQ
ncbi:MAG: SurA N-terminal domain-containing protein, partial [Hyphomicrobiales bacterium]